ncbi:ABC transporter ATP-binding protein [Nakamurella lactea]|uniref:ABC transporter ATP-binding protein n=1 Tax=Nakamurella lactea TaxID=459515 RepID=UPI001B7FB65A|nr:ABC transporter ATP-binding protein [Nakamurella lactea]
MASLGSVRERPSWQFFAAMAKSVTGMATLWWAILLVRALIPAAIAVTTGWLVGSVQQGAELGPPLVGFAVVFLASQVAPPVHQVVGTLLGHRFSGVLNERLMTATTGPDGIGHLERGDLTNDLTTARDFDLGWTGPPMYLNMDFIAAGLVTLLGGIASAVVLFGLVWWAPLVLLAAWGSTHWLLRESGVWRDRNTAEVKTARRHTDYAYNLATEPPAAKEVRLFGLGEWLLERFTRHRLQLHDLQYRATKIRERSLVGALVLVLAGNVLVFWVLAGRAFDGAIGLQAVVTYAGAAFGASATAFGGLSWAMDGAAAPVVALNTLEPAMAAGGALSPGRPAGGAVAPASAPEIRFRDVTFGYPGVGHPVLEHFDLTIPAGTSMAIVGQNGAGKTTVAKLLCRLYDPDSGAIEIDGVDLRDLDLPRWRERLAAVFQDFVRYELPLRLNVAPLGADDALLADALRAAGAERLAEPDTPMAKGYPGGIDVSGGQWQRIALARAVAKVGSGAKVVLLDEPTAMLDVRGEHEIFRRLLEATVDTTTILVSHRFSTVRLAQRICVVEHGQVVETGSHDELIALGGRYRHMYELQASRFVEVDEHGEEVVHESL